MNWLQKLPGSIRSASGLEWTLWRKLPAIALIGSAVPVLVLGAYHLVADVSSPAQERALQLVDYAVLGVLAVHWTAILTVGIGCIIVMIMKGPGYVADGLAVSHSDHPRAEPEP